MKPIMSYVFFAHVRQTYLSSCRPRPCQQPNNQSPTTPEAPNTEKFEKTPNKPLIAIITAFIL